MPEPLTAEEVKHIARLARLHLSDVELEGYRGELSSVLDHVAKLGQLDLSGIEPMARPIESVNRLDEDAIAPADVSLAMSLEELAMNAPAMEGRFIAVPKIIGEAGN